MMINSTQVSFFTLAAYFDGGLSRYLYFMITMSLYMSIVGSNVLLIAVICVNRSLHEPMYMFLCSLFVNELYGSTGLFPFLLLQILSDVHTVPAAACFLQILCVYSYGGVEYLTLAVMSYDRYLAICRPLQYNAQMTCKNIVKLIASVWLLSFVAYTCTVSMVVRLQLCGNIIQKVYCDYHSIVKLSCSDTTVNNIYGLLIGALTVFGPLVFILYTYMKILKVCFSGSKQTRQKAVSTCSPHLASLLNFSFGTCFEVLQSRFDMNRLPNMLRIFLSLYFLMCPPLFNPVMYGLKLSKLRVICKNLILN